MPTFNRFSRKPPGSIDKEDDDELDGIARGFVAKNPAGSLPGFRPDARPTGGINITGDERTDLDRDGRSDNRIPSDRERVADASKGARGNDFGSQVRPGGAGNPNGRGTGSGAQGTDPTSDGLDDIAKQHAAERQAAQDELRASKAKELQQADARAGLGGFGLSGASTALRGDIARTQDRTATLALADLDKKQRDEEFQRTVQEAALADLELTADRDFNNDGLIDGEKVTGDLGDGDPENNPSPEGDRKKGNGERESVRTAEDYLKLGEGGAPGSGTRPFLMDGNSMKDLEADGYEFTEVSTNGSGDTFYTDQDGNYWIVRGGS